MNKSKEEKHQAPIRIEDLREFLESGNINFLFGAGTSHPCLPLLGDIEDDIDKAAGGSIYEPLKKYYKGAMLPHVDLLEKDFETCDAFSTYKEFFDTMLGILLNRKLNLLKRQVNIFTTNIDILMENTLAKMELVYNDGFSGGYGHRVFDIGSYQRRFQQESRHYGFKSDVPVFNILKMHGSLSWGNGGGDEKIVLRDRDDLIRILREGDLLMATTKPGDWEEWYKKKVLVVTPSKAKLIKSVTDIMFSELLRFYADALEKENSLLFVIGFSMNDQHIRELTLRVAKLNPTLTIYIFCYDRCAVEKINGKILANSSELHNIKVISPETKIISDSSMLKGKDKEKKDKGTALGPLALDNITKGIFKHI